LVKTIGGQFQIWTLKLRGPRKLSSASYVMVLQSRRLDDLATVITAPLFESTRIGELGRIRPEILIKEVKHRIVFDKLSVLERSNLLTHALDASTHEWLFKAALDELLL
jgi:CcdB protein